MNTKILDDIKTINEYLYALKNLIINNECHFKISDRDKNNNFCKEYLINTKIAKDIIYELTYKDFYKIVKNEHKDYENEFLYIFGPVKELVNRMGKREKVQLYIKINYIKDKVIILVSLHKAESKIELKYGSD